MKVQSSSSNEECYVKLNKSTYCQVAAPKKEITGKMNEICGSIV